MRVKLLDELIGISHTHESIGTLNSSLVHLEGILFDINLLGEKGAGRLLGMERYLSILRINHGQDLFLYFVS